MAASPRLAIGLPVRNGERYLLEAARCLLAQSFGDFTLLIADNASTDATPDIARALARSDARVTYARHEHNIGAAANFNFVFRSTRGEFFKWAADDDLCAPEFLARCLACLEASAGTVLAHSATRWIDAQGCVLGPLPLAQALADPLPGGRFAAALRPGYPAAIWGVMRREAAASTGLIGGFVNADRYFLAELLLRGRAAIVDEQLFAVRQHDRSFTSGFGRLSHRQRLHWFDPGGRLSGVPAMVGFAVRVARHTAAGQLPVRTGLGCAAFLIRRAAGFVGHRMAAALPGSPKARHNAGRRRELAPPTNDRSAAARTVGRFKNSNTTEPAVARRAHADI